MVGSNSFPDRYNTYIDLIFSKYINENEIISVLDHMSLLKTG